MIAIDAVASAGTGRIACVRVEVEVMLVVKKFVATNVKMLLEVTRLVVVTMLVVVWTVFVSLVDTRVTVVKVVILSVKAAVYVKGLDVSLTRKLSMWNIPRKYPA